MVIMTLVMVNDSIGDLLKFVLNDLDQEDPLIQIILTLTDAGRFRFSWMFSEKSGDK